MMRGHIADSTSLLSILNEVYLKHVNYLVTGLSAQLQDCDRLAAEVHIIIIIAQSRIISDTETERLELLRDRLEYLSSTLAVFDSILDNAARNSTHQWHYFPDRLLIGDCNTVFRNVNKSLEYHIYWLDDFMPSINESVVSPVDAIIFSNMTSLRSNMSSLSKCLTSYKEELENLENWLNLMPTSTFDTKLAYEPPVATLSNFQSGGKWLDNIAERYIANYYSKKELAEMFNRNSDHKVTTPISRLYSDMKTSLFSKISDLIDEQEKDMVSFYSDLLQRVTSLQRYMFPNDTSLEQFMRRLSIWRMPTVNFQDSQVYYYLYI